MNISNCNDNNLGNICDINDMYKNKLYFTNVVRRFSNKHRIENIIIWDKLFHNIRVTDGSYLMDRYKIVIVIHLHLFYEMFPKLSKKKDKILVYHHSDIMFIAIGDYDTMNQSKVK